MVTADSESLLNARQGSAVLIISPDSAKILLEDDSSFNPIPQMRKLRPREVEGWSQHPMVSDKAGVQVEVYLTSKS